MSTDDTLPPRKPNTFRTWLPRIWAFLWLHREYALPAAAFVLGWAVGKVL